MPRSPGRRQHHHRRGPCHRGQRAGHRPWGNFASRLRKRMPVSGADQVGNYLLKSAGADGLLGTGDDVNVPITSATYSGTTATLNFPALPADVYRLTVTSAITDTSGTALDGNGDGIAGDNHVVDFAGTPAATYTP